MDQFDIAQPLVEYAQHTKGGNINIEYDGQLSGTRRDPTYSRYDLLTRSGDRRTPSPPHSVGNGPIGVRAGESLQTVSADLR
ncbi:hypothetical protein [Streptomyces violascens]|uniref:Uncharacterized protein n=1 Tax=Streptomyces violascens TaxID=67381 RepID=A0ABQ3QWJ6_9ACTN|nr:hypothetical protein [Streptomyces violascens]GHI41655.1 hypothetical protein Sviol_60630 [Streptomyces violascens]